MSEERGKETKKERKKERKQDRKKERRRKRKSKERVKEETEERKGKGEEREQCLIRTIFDAKSYRFLYRFVIVRESYVCSFFLAIIKKAV